MGECTSCGKYVKGKDRDCARCAARNASQATWEDRPTEVELVEERLSDDSKVYAVEVRQHEQVIKFDCIDQHKAASFLTHLEDILDSYTINDYKTL